jgi:hypothetical protein
VRVRSVDGMTVTSDVDVLAEDGALLLRLEAYLCTASASLQRAFVAEGPGAVPSPVA